MEPLLVAVRQHKLAVARGRIGLWKSRILISLLAYLKKRKEISMHRCNHISFVLKTHVLKITNVRKYYTVLPTWLEIAHDWYDTICYSDYSIFSRISCCSSSNFVLFIVLLRMALSKMHATNAEVTWSWQKKNITILRTEEIYNICFQNLKLSISD